MYISDIYLTSILAFGEVTRSHQSWKPELTVRDDANEKIKRMKLKKAETAAFNQELKNKTYPIMLFTFCLYYLL